MWKRTDKRALAPVRSPRLSGTFAGCASLRVRRTGMRGVAAAVVTAVVVTAVAAVAAGILLAGDLTVVHGQSRSTPSRPAENVVQGVRRSWEKRPADFRTRTASCLHYLDEAEARHNEGVAYFDAASRARSSAEQTPLVRKGNEAIAERTRLIKEFWACARRMTTGDEFHSQGPPRAPGKDQPPPDDPIDAPPAYVPPPERPAP